MRLLELRSTSERGTDVKPMTKPKSRPSRYRLRVGNDIGTMCVRTDSMSLNEFHLAMNFTLTGSRTEVSGIKVRILTRTLNLVRLQSQK